MCETEQFWIIVFSSTMEVNGAQNSLMTNFHSQNQAVLGTTDFHSRRKYYDPELLCSPHSSEYLCVQQNKHIHTGLEILESG